MFSSIRVSRVSLAVGFGIAAACAPLFALADPLSIQSLTPGATVPVATSLSFSVTGGGSNSPKFYISDSFAGSSVNNDRINSAGNFNWTPLIQDIGAHTISISTYDASGTSASITQAVTVVPRLRVLIQSLSPGTSVNPGQLVTFTATTSGFSNPAYSVSDSFAGGTLWMNAINSVSGAFSWTPAAADVGTHTITVQAADSSSNNSSATQQIVVAGAATTTTLATTLTTTAPLPGGTPAPAPAIPTPAPAAPAPVSTIPASAYAFTSYLKLGSSGDEVTALQNLLARGGYYGGEATGYFGSLTSAALKKYQSAHGLDALGVVGPSTRAALNAEAGGSSAPTAPTIAPSVSNNSAARLKLIRQLLVQLQQMQALLIQLEAVND